MMRIVFCGTPSFAVPTLKRLLAQPDIEIVDVITQPDRPRGRGQDVSFSAVKETAPELAARLSEVGASLMVETLRGLAAGTIAAKAQNHGEASNAPMLKKEDGRIDWKRSAREIYNRMRGFAPWPGAYTTFRGQT